MVQGGAPLRTLRIVSTIIDATASMLSWLAHMRPAPLTGPVAAASWADDLARSACSAWAALLWVPREDLTRVGIDTLDTCVVVWHRSGGQDDGPGRHLNSAPLDKRP